MNLTDHHGVFLKNTEANIRASFVDEGSGHDWWHINRVCKLTLKIAEKEGGNRFIMEMAALLHDLDDWKITGTSDETRVEEWLDKIEVPVYQKKRIIEVVEQVSFKGAGVANKALSIEAKIVQDADRLDAIGAIGIARAFAYGGNRNRLIFDPNVKPEMHTNFQSYKNNTAPTINHFYEKLLLLKDKLNTETAKKIAKKRHHYMENFLKQFYAEWNGKL